MTTLFCCTGLCCCLPACWHCICLHPQIYWCSVWTAILVRPVQCPVKLQSGICHSSLLAQAPGASKPLLSATGQMHHTAMHNIASPCMLSPCTTSLLWFMCMSMFIQHIPDLFSRHPSSPQAADTVLPPSAVVMLYLSAPHVTLLCVAHTSICWLPIYISFS